MSTDITQRGGSTAEPQVEVRDTPVRAVALTLAGLVAALLLVCAMVAGLLLFLSHRAPPLPGPPDPALRPPAPRLQAYEPAQRILLERRAAAALAPGPGRIGIDAAMRRTAAEGWPDEGAAR